MEVEEQAKSFLALPVQWCLFLLCTACSTIACPFHSPVLVDFYQRNTTDEDLLWSQPEINRKDCGISVGRTSDLQIVWHCYASALLPRHRGDWEARPLKQARSRRRMRERKRRRRSRN